MIHPSAIVDSKAEISTQASIGPYCVIGPGVQIGAGTVLHSHVVIQANTTLGESNEIYPYAVLGAPPQDLKYKGAASRLEIGSRNIIREHVSIHRSNSPEEPTRMGNENFIMGETHIGHNCQLGNKIILTQGAGLAGHVRIEDQANIGGKAAIHQFARVGRLAMVGGMAAVLKDVPPFAKVIGLPAFFIGINQRGLEQNALLPETIAKLSQALEILFKKSASLEDGIAKIRALGHNGTEIYHLIEFLQGSQRGICN